MYCCASVRQTIDYPETGTGIRYCFWGYRDQQYPYSHGVEVRVDLGVQHRNYNCATQILIRNSSENVVSIVGDIISIIEAFLNFFLVYKLENLEKPYLLIRFLWFICKVSSFFRTFTKQSIVDSNNITLTAVREKRKTKPRANKHKYVFTLVRMHVRMTSKRRTKRNAGSGTRCEFDTDPSSRCGPIFKIILRMLRKISWRFN